MIVNKTQKEELDQEVKYEAKVTESTAEQEEYTVNALCEVIKAVKEVLSKIPENEDNPDIPVFKTIALNTGQLGKIKNSKQNKEYEILFPAVFLHFVNVRYLVQQSRIGEGRATLRIQYVLNRLNSGDPEYELEGFEMFNKINIALQDAKDHYPALNERFQLTYFDQPESFDDGLQPYWIDYEVWFKEYSAYKYRKYVDRYFVVPPFTNHSDQEKENNPEEHPDHTQVKYDDASKIQIPNETNLV